MAKNRIQEGRTLTLTAPVGGVVGGRAYLIGTLVVVAEFSADAGELFEGNTEGVYEMPKTAANTPAEGDAAYLIAATGVFTTTATANTLAGVFTQAQINGDATCRVRLG